MKDELGSLADSLPEQVRDFLDAGGWWLVGGLLALVVLLLLWALVDRLLRALFRRKQISLEESDREFLEDLTSYPPAPPQGDRRLTLYHLPVRLRLVVMAPIGTESGIEPRRIGQLLDRIVPGLEEVAVSEQARVRIWPPQLSQQGFTIAFQRRTRRAEPEGSSSHWVLAVGRAQAGQQVVLLGLALWTEEPTTVGRVLLEPYQWLDVLRIKVAER